MHGEDFLSQTHANIITKITVESGNFAHPSICDKR